MKETKWSLWKIGIVLIVLFLIIAILSLTLHKTREGTNVGPKDVGQPNEEISQPANATDGGNSEWEKTLPDVKHSSLQDNPIQSSSSNEESGINSLVVENTTEEQFTSFQQELIQNGWKKGDTAISASGGQAYVLFQKDNVILKIMRDDVSKTMTIMRNGFPTSLMLAGDKSWQDILSSGIPAPKSGRVTFFQEIRSGESVVAQRVQVDQIIQASVDTLITDLQNAGWEAQPKDYQSTYNEMVDKKCGSGLDPAAAQLEASGISASSEAVQQIIFSNTELDALLELFYVQNTLLLTHLLP